MGMTEFTTARRNMIDGQLRPGEVTDPAILDAMAALPRERFVPKALRGAAYCDEDIPLGDGRFLMKPLVLARLLTMAEPTPGDVALVVGCASGYDAAILARLVATVVAVECDPRLAGDADAALSELGVDNAAVVEGPLAEGWAAQAPYDVILFSGAARQVPQAILDQLGHGGRLVTVIRTSEFAPGRAELLLRGDGSVSRRIMYDAMVHMLPGLAPAPEFVF